MPCPHLKPLENALAAAGMEETARGQLWSQAEEFVYFHCRIDQDGARERFNLDPCVEWSEHRGTHEGSEAGFFCTRCRTGVMGLHAADTGPETPVFP